MYYKYNDPCHNTNDGCGVQTETCAYKSGNNNPGCYTVWSGNKKMLQGCWLPSSRQDCTPGDCISREDQLISKLKQQRTYFCCCFGDNCNKNYGISNHVLQRWYWERFCLLLWENGYFIEKIVRNRQLAYIKREQSELSFVSFCHLWFSNLVFILVREFTGDGSFCEIEWYFNSKRLWLQDLLI